MQHASFFLPGDLLGTGSWVAQMRRLRALKLATGPHGYGAGHRRFACSLASFSQLERLHLHSFSLARSAQLPPSLTGLHLTYDWCTAMPQQVG